MRVEVTFSGTLTTDAPDPAAEFEQVLDATMEELLRLPVIDPAMSGSFADGTLEVRVTVRAEDVAAAVTLAHSSLRSALHAAGVNTAKMHGPVQVNWHKIEADDLIDA